MVKAGVDFVVYDAKTGEDITRPVLAQIIFDEEGRGASLLPIQFLRQLISFYGHSMQSFLPSYLELSLNSFTKQQDHFIKQFGTGALGSGALGSEGLGVALYEEQVRQNMAMFDRAIKIFSPFSVTPGAAAESSTETKPPPPSVEPAANTDELLQLKKQMEAMRREIDRLVPKA